jgi:hypothetical protein
MLEEKMFKLSEAGDLEKAGRSLGSFFIKRAEELQKTHAFHAAVAAHHDAAAAQHTTRASAYKASHDGLPNDHELKSQMAAGHTHHTAMAAHHAAIAKAHADHAGTLKAEVDAIKALAADWGGVATAKAAGAGPASSALTVEVVKTGNVIVDMVQEATAQLTKKSLEKFDTDPEVQQYLRDTIMKMVGEAIGNTVVPTGVSAVAPNQPGVTVVPRAGQRPLPEKPNVDVQFSKLVQVDEEEQLLIRK